MRKLVINLSSMKYRRAMDLIFIAVVTSGITVSILHHNWVALSAWLVTTLFAVTQLLVNHIAEYWRQTAKDWEEVAGSYEKLYGNSKGMLLKYKAHLQDGEQPKSSQFEN